MSAFRLAAFCRIAGCRRVLFENGAGHWAGREGCDERARYHRPMPHRARRPRSGRAQVAEAPRWKMLHRPLQLGGRVLPGQPVLSDRLAEQPWGKRGGHAPARPASAATEKRTPSLPASGARIAIRLPARHGAAPPASTDPRSERVVPAGGGSASKVLPGGRVRSSRRLGLGRATAPAVPWLAPAMTRTRTPGRRRCTGTARAARCRGRRARSSSCQQAGEVDPKLNAGLPVLLGHLGGVMPRPAVAK